MLARALSGAVLGIDAYLVRVEADVANGVPSFATVGLPQGAVREGKERVVSAIRNSRFDLPPRRITINLAPADIRKEGSAFDLPIAVGILAGTGQLPESSAEGFVLLGELGLDGSLCSVRGVLPVAVMVRELGLRGLVVPAQNLAEASVVEGVAVHGARSLAEVIGFLRGERRLARRDPMQSLAPEHEDAPALDLAEVRGQAHAKRALEVAAAGAHNLLMLGPPGTGKTMLARRLPGILPPMTLEESIETTKIHSVAGLLGPGVPLIRRRPFRAPHHTTSDAGLIGGGSNPRPGEVSLAHHGVLFLDELPEFRRNVLEALRQPLEDACVTIARAGLTLAYPATFMLAAAMNPCPCGYLGDPQRACVCTPRVVQRYLTRVSGPLLDRLDLHVEVPAVAPGDLARTRAGEPSSVVRERVARARSMQSERFRHLQGVHANAQMKPADLRRFCPVDRPGRSLLTAASRRLGLSARAFHRIIKIARTIGDLEGSDSIAEAHLAEAIQYRSADRIVGTAQV